MEPARRDIRGLLDSPAQGFVSKHDEPLRSARRADVGQGAAMRGGEIFYVREHHSPRLEAFEAIDRPDPSRRSTSCDSARAFSGGTLADGLR